MRGKKVFALKRKIRLSDTDATGCIYFINQLKFASEAFEAFIESRFGKLTFETHSLPIVHVQSQYFAPLRMGDEILLQLHIKSLSRSTIEVHVDILLNDQKAGEVTMKHVFISIQTGRSTEIPANFRLALDSLGQS